MIVGRFQGGKIIRILRRRGGGKMGKKEQKREKGSGGRDCGLRIADCGLRIYVFVQPRTRNRDRKFYQSAIRNPQSATRNPYPDSLRDAELSEDEGVIERHVAQAVVAPGSPAVTARLQL